MNVADNDRCDFEVVEGTVRSNEISRGEMRDRLEKRFTALLDAGGEARPHVEFPIDRTEFRQGVEDALDGEPAELERDEYVITIDTVNLKLGQISLSGAIKQYVETSLSELDAAADPADVGTPDLLDEYYPNGTTPVQTDTEHPDVKKGYTTLLRDLSESCAEAVDEMRAVVDEHPDLVWGEEPKITGMMGSYDFAGAIYYRPNDQ